MDAIDLDHVAIAVEQWADAWPRFAGDLGGQWQSGGQGPGFAPSQLKYANGMKVELIAVHRPDLNDFLRRFLDRSGPGPHHFTFKVPSLERSLEQVEEAGYRPIGVDLSDPDWKEAFLHPKDAAIGVVVQLAQPSGEGWVTDPPRGFPEQQRPQASLLHVAHAVTSVERALGLFRDLLGGEVVQDGDDEAARWVELRWPGPGRIRLLEPASPSSPLATWLGDLPGRVHHVAFACPDPAAIEGAVPLAGGAYEIAPEDANGARLLLTPA